MKAKKEAKNYVKLNESIFRNKAPEIRSSTKDVAQTLAGIHVS